ncbi:putative nucleoporin, NSP1-like, nucleoporin NSP1/NUP62 [Helianthus annuus]|uniref:Nucleoporin, NSP1-like, nucleoporin NSP1/NUP62 n=1 Tax=Helianthus annuus TaxID=4232 RepID=A0A9K3JGN3_HELAN|nr:putative nucleoporin, NSP1-like, nucleoporin NSP1/NUP62 [Helianthus annuus]KAJ0774236.1 putative nucleoporin, NSP1-like, nucleoporin NSP1/NUP62 [Helianthus annuus]KAJ0944083.1 putative nucleoporin, NSP1-like, nucleoporin NSP1/NUP62 [Helianthus annuus]
MTRFSVRVEPANTRNYGKKPLRRYPYKIIKEWNVELQERTSKFRKQANAIAEWDRRILQNRDVLLKLEAKVAKVVDTQSNLERHRS